MKSQHLITVEFEKREAVRGRARFVAFVGVPHLRGDAWNDLIRSTSAIGYDAMRASDGG